MVEQSFGWRRARARDSCLLARGVVMAFLVVAAGCATTGRLTKDSSPEAKVAAVSERVNARWDALIKSDLALAYTYLSPASREIVSLESYKRQARGTGFQDAKIDKVECDGAVCNVRLFVTYDHRMIKGLTTPLDEKWVIDEGKAWYVWAQ